MELNLRGRSALVTGASRGIGLAIARAFAVEGCNLHLAARDAERLGKVARELCSEFGVEAEPHPSDLSLSSDVKALGAACADVDIVVNNAGGIPRGTLQEVESEAWKKSWDLKVFGYIDLTRILLPRMCARKAGVIINVIGSAGERPNPNYVAGCAANAALNMFSQCLAGESMRHGVRVLAVNPGPIMSDRFQEGLHWRAERRFRDRDRWPEILASELPSGRAGVPEEVASAVVFLASDRASYISGAQLRIDGGFTVRPTTF